MLFTEVVSASTLDLLRKLQSLPDFADLRLVGGTSLALQIGHRISVDLDFFGKEDSSLDELTDLISKFASVSPLSSSRLMRFLIVNGVKVDIVNYPYPWIDSPVISDGLVLAGIKDIAAMKLSAITNRGTKKDFIDYYFLLQRFSLDELIEFYKQKYSDYQLFTALKSLTFFEDAENDPMPKMIQPVDWSVVKSSICERVSAYLKKQS